MIALRTLARPGIRLAEALYRRETMRRLMVEANEEFDNYVVVDGIAPAIRIGIASRMEHQRAGSLFTKEPDTIQWLDQLRPGDLFVDIGANIGVYTLYAAIRSGARVLAFEPEAQNFAALNRNIHANSLSDLVTAYPVALSDRNGPTVLHLSRVASGASHHAIDMPIGEGGQGFEPAFTQGTVALTLDATLAAVTPDTVPRFVKIDVDGVEGRIVEGMARLLENPALEQVLIELAVDEVPDRSIVARLREHGFEVSPPASTYHGRGNHIFRRGGSAGKETDR